MPLVLTTWNNNIEKPFISLYPHPEAIGEVLMDIIKAWEWTSFTVLYESAQWLPNVSNLLKMYDAKGHTITVRQLSVGQNTNYRNILKRVKDSGDKHIIIDCSLDMLPEVLKQAQQVGLLTEAHQFIITNLDMHTLDLEPYQYSGTNITGIRMIDPDDVLVQTVTDFWIKNYKIKLNEKGNNQHDYNRNPYSDDQNVYNDPNYEYQRDNHNSPENDEDFEIPEMFLPSKLPTSVALIYDGLLLFAEAFKQFQGIEEISPIELSCDSKDSTWPSGFSLSNYMRTVGSTISYIHKDKILFKLFY